MDKVQFPCQRGNVTVTGTSHCPLEHKNIFKDDRMEFTRSELA